MINKISKLLIEANVELVEPKPQIKRLFQLLIDAELNNVRNSCYNFDDDVDFEYSLHMCELVSKIESIEVTKVIYEKFINKTFNNYKVFLKVTTEESDDNLNADIPEFLSELSWNVKKSFETNFTFEEDKHVHKNKNKRLWGSQNR